MIEQYPIPQPEEKKTLARYQSPVDSCEHIFELRRMLCSNGAVQFKKQCPRCGKGLSAISHSTLSPQERKQAPLFDQDLQDTVRQAAWEQWKASAEHERWDGWFEWYAGYLASPIWSRRRAAVLRRSRGMCESCGKMPAKNVHHLTYKNVGAEPLFELVAVCSPCHDQIHRQETP